MRKFYYDLQINDAPILVPDQDLEMEYNDLDSDETGRDEAGVMHRIVLREGIRKFALVYDTLTRAEYQYMRSLFAGKPQFTVKYRDHDGTQKSFEAYHSNHSITVHNTKTGLYKNYKISIIEC